MIERQTERLLFVAAMCLMLIVSVLSVRHAYSEGHRLGYNDGMRDGMEKMWDFLVPWNPVKHDLPEERAK